jgi:hypothetical protein
MTDTPVFSAAPTHEAEPPTRAAALQIVLQPEPRGWLRRLVTAQRHRIRRIRRR